MNLAVIPARGGSKRIPKKNVRLFHQKPMLSYSISAALESKLFDDVIVSTDDDAIAEIARKQGATVPFTRPAEISDDHTGILEVVNHSIEWYQSNVASVENIALIYATAPFITADVLIDAFSLLDANSCSYVLPVARFSFPIQRALKIGDSGRVDMVEPEHRFTRSQDLPETYHDAGQFCLGKVDAFLNKEDIYSNKTLPYFLPMERVQDIDTEEDWARAELLYQLLMVK